LNHSWRFPRIAKSSGQSKILKMTKDGPLAHLYFTAAAHTQYNELQNESHYQELVNQSANLTDISVAISDFAVHQGVASGFDSSNFASYLKSRRISTCLLNVRNNAVNLEVLVFRAKVDIQQSVSTLLNSALLNPTHAVPAGIDPAGIVHTAGYPVVPVTDYQFHYSMAPLFMDKYKLVSKRHVKVPPGGRCYINNTCHFGEMLTKSTIASFVSAGVTYLKGTHIVVIRSKTLPMIGGVVDDQFSVNVNNPGFGGINWQTLTRFTTVGGRASTLGLEATAYGVAPAPESLALGNILEHWEDDSDKMVHETNVQ